VAVQQSPKLPYVGSIPTRRATCNKINTCYTQAMRTIIDEIEDLLKFEMKLSDRVGTNTLQITKPRARLLLQRISDYKTKTKKAAKINKTPAFFSYLDEKLLEKF